MNKQLIEDLKREQENKKAYEAAKQANDEAGKEEARTNYKELMISIENRGEGYLKVFNLLSEAKKRQNENIDISEAWEYKDEKMMIEIFREQGIERFTFSSSWSSAIETAWAFIQNGCTLEGMTEINTQYKRFMSDEYEKSPAYIFKVN